MDGEGYTLISNYKLQLELTLYKDWLTISEISATRVPRYEI
jgi:hypothetical protein